MNADEAATVRQIFATYLELGSVSALERWLAEQGIALEAAHDRAAAGRPAAGRSTAARSSTCCATAPTSG